MALQYLYAPSGYEPGKANGILPNIANADLGFVRNSSATRINAEGLIENMNANVPRLDYTDGSCPTLLTERGSTNLLFNSTWAGSTSLPNNWVYGAQNGTSTPVTSTRGTYVQAYRFQTTNDRHYIARTITTVIGRTYVSSIYVESVTGSSQLQHILYRIGGGGTDVFKKDGVVVTQNEPVVAGSFYSITFTSLTSEQLIYRVGLGVIGNATGDVTLSQPQLTYRYAFNNRTSFIPTPVDASQSRSEEAGIISGDLSSYINSSEGVLEIRAKASFNGGNDVRISISDRTTDNRLSLVWSEVTDRMRLVMKANGGDVFDGGTIGFKNFTYDQTEMATFKIKWKSGDIQVKANGRVVLTETDTFTMLGLKKISLGKGYGGSSLHFEGNVEYIKLYDSVDDF